MIRPIVRLRPGYARFCAFETCAINGVGCTSLVFQTQLRDVCPYPGLYEYWFSPPIPATDTEFLMTFMIAGWLAVAGVLQAAINFDECVPVRTKWTAVVCFAACDVAWIALMIKYTALFSAYHIVGSVYTIGQRAYFLAHPDELFWHGNLSFADDFA